MYIKEMFVMFLCAGADGVFDDITLLHVLVTLKELLLRCDLHTAAGKYDQNTHLS